MFHEILCIANSMVGEALLPHRNLGSLSEPIRVASLDKLNRAFERMIRGGRNQQVKMIGHDDKFVQKKFSLLTVVKENVQQEPCLEFVPEDGVALPCDGRDEKCSVRIHPRIVVRRMRMGSDLRHVGDIFVPEWDVWRSIDVWIAVEERRLQRRVNRSCLTTRARKSRSSTVAQAAF